MYIQKQKIIAMVVGIVFIGGLAIFFLFGKKNESRNSLPSFEFSSLLDRNKNEEVGGEVELPADSTGLPRAGSSTSNESIREGYELYKNESYGFSFEYPTGMTISEIPEDFGYTLLAQGVDRKTFQVFILPYDEPGSLTVERIRQDLPKMKIENEQSVVIGTKAAAGGKIPGVFPSTPGIEEPGDAGIPALIFFSDHPSLGKTREIWFVWPPDPYPHGNYLYQITTHGDMDNFIGPILDTLNFSD